MGANQTISHYRILEKLGAGGMGEVHLAEDTRLTRKVAIKFLPEASRSDPQARKRLIREARSAAALDHPNICSIYEVGEEEERSFIVMQYVEGETLSARMHRKPLELGECLDIAAQVVDGLAEAHSRGIIHRDMKPENIMLTPRGQVKVMDFGLAKLMEQATADRQSMTASARTEQGTIVGTVPYMSPEQVRGEVVDTRSDIFSFGVVLYEMVSGRQPFASESAAATASAILTREPPPLARYSKEAPAELERIVSKAVRKDREKRYQSVEDLALDLKTLREQLEFEAKLERSRSRDSEVQPTLQRVSAELKRHKVPVILAVAALAITVAAVAYFAGSRDDRVIDSLAVLPFVNVGADSNTEYLSDGLTDSLINSLAQLPNLRVISRTSAFRYKGREADPVSVGRELKVKALITGRIVRRGDHLSISAELVDALNNSHLWGEQYNRRLSDILPVPEEMAKEISRKLQLRLSPSQHQLLTKSPTGDSEAYRFYLQGRYYWNKLAEEETKKAIEYFNRAIERDPSYALAYAGLADCYSHLVLFGSSPPKDTFPKAKAAALKAIDLDGSLAAGHSALGRVKFHYDWDWQGAQKEFKRAIELNPNDAITREAYSVYLRGMERFDEAMAEMKVAQELDPLSPYVSGSVGWMLYFMGRYDEAIAKFRRTLEMDPTYGNPHWGVGRALVEKGMYKEAIAEMQRGGPDFASPLGSLGHAYAQIGDIRAAERLLGEARNNPIRAVDAACIYAGLGQKDQALEWLQKAYDARSPWLVFCLKPDPRFHGFRSDPRFADLLRRLELPQ
jgi:serine/threonine protein kinase/Flp pilus assembly protein TadD